MSAPERTGVLHDVRRLAGSTFSICMRHRVTGLAAEIGFFALLSLPPLILGLVGTLGYFADVIGPDTVEEVRTQLIELSRHALSAQAVDQVVDPTLDDVLDGGRIEIMSAGFLLALWSGSRALNVIIDTITIMYGLGGKRGIIATRALSFSLYLVALIIAIVLVPLVVAGPQLAGRTLPESAEWVSTLYWPVVVILSVASVTTLFWISVPVPNSWWRGVPGAVLALLGWVGGSYLVRVAIDWSISGGTSIYGPLTASIIVLIWLYALAITMLIGAAFNAAVDRRWPQRVDQRTLAGTVADVAVPIDEPPTPVILPVQHLAGEYSRDDTNVVPLTLPEPEPKREPRKQEVKRHGRR